MAGDPSLQILINAKDQTAGAFKTLEKSLKALGLAAIAATTVATKQALDFEKQLSNVATLLDGDVTPQIEKFREGIMSIESPKSLNELAEGMFYVQSSMQFAGQEIEALTAIQNLAVAGMTDMKTASSAVVGTMKAYGDESLNAAEIGDLLFQINKRGFTTFEEIAQSMPKVTSAANTLGVSQRELAAAMATLVGSTGNADEVSTQLKATFVALMKPSENMKDALNAIGFESGFAAVESLGLEGTLQALYKQAGNNKEGFSALFNNIRALTGVIPLASSLSGKFSEDLEAMADASGSVSRAVDIQQQNIKDKLAIAWNEFVKIIDDVVYELSPLVIDALEGISQWLADNRDEIKEWTQAFVKSLKWIADNWNALSAAVTAVLDVIKQAIALAIDTSILPLMRSVAAISDGFGLVENDVSRAADSIVKEIEGISRSLKGTSSTMKETFTGFIDKAKGKFDEYKEKGLVVFDAVKEAAHQHAIKSDQDISTFIDGAVSNMEKLKKETEKDFDEMEKSILDFDKQITDDQNATTDRIIALREEARDVSIQYEKDLLDARKDAKEQAIKLEEDYRKSIYQQGLDTSEKLAGVVVENEEKLAKSKDELSDLLQEKERAKRHDESRDTINAIQDKISAKRHEITEIERLLDTEYEKSDTTIEAINEARKVASMNEIERILYEDERKRASLQIQFELEKEKLKNETQLKEEELRKQMELKQAQIDEEISAEKTKSQELTDLWNTYYKSIIDQDNAFTEQFKKNRAEESKFAIENISKTMQSYNQLDTNMQEVAKLKDQAERLKEKIDKAKAIGKTDVAAKGQKQLNDILSQIKALGIQSFATGGVVGGEIGSPQLIMAHGGETVLPTKGGMPITINIQGNVYDEKGFKRAIENVLIPSLKQNAKFMR